MIQVCIPRARPPSVRDHVRWKKTSITKDVTSHILTVIKSLTKSFLDTKNGIVRPLCVGAPTPTTTLGSHLRARRVGEAQLNNALYPNHVMKCIHTVHRHKRCYECCCYSRTVPAAKPCNVTAGRKYIGGCESEL